MEIPLYRRIGQFGGPYAAVLVDNYIVRTVLLHILKSQYGLVRSYERPVCIKDTRDQPVRLIVDRPHLDAAIACGVSANQIVYVGFKCPDIPDLRGFVNLLDSPPFDALQNWNW